MAIHLIQCFAIFSLLSLAVKADSSNSSNTQNGTLITTSPYGTVTTNIAVLSTPWPLGLAFFILTTVIGSFGLPKEGSDRRPLFSCFGGGKGQITGYLQNIMAIFTATRCLLYGFHILKALQAGAPWAMLETKI